MARFPRSAGPLIVAKTGCQGIRFPSSQITVLLVLTCLLQSWIRVLGSNNSAGGYVPRSRLSADDLKIYIYKHPPHIPLWEHRGVYWEQRWLEEWVRGTKHYTSNGSEAHYFWIPYFKGIGNISAVLEVFKYIREDYPWWNATKSARHILMTTFDLGPGNLYSESKLNDPAVPDDINPASPNRRVLFMHFHGQRDGADSGAPACWVCFQKGKDVMLPKDQGVCGPLCGYTMPELQNKSVWSRTGPSLWRPRKHLLFYGGAMGYISMADMTGRGQVYIHYKNRTRYLIVNTKPPDNERVDFSQAMLDSEFCFSPLGGNAGPTDRYIAALMFGCIPVFLSTSSRNEKMSQPFDEVVPWQLFSTSIQFRDIPSLDAHLQALLPYVHQMRRHMSHFVWNLLYSSRYGSYFGEASGSDALATLLRVLYQRLPHADTRRFTSWGTADQQLGGLPPEGSVGAL